MSKEHNQETLTFACLVAAARWVIEASEKPYTSVDFPLRSPIRKLKEALGMLDKLTKEPQERPPIRRPRGYGEHLEQVLLDRHQALAYLAAAAEEPEPEVFVQALQDCIRAENLR